jgi:hypothetical protein
MLMTVSPLTGPAIAAISPVIHTSSISASSVSQQQVIEFTNSSNLTVSYQFRWNSSSSWSNNTLAPGASYYFWTPSTSVSPQITFDQSVLPGWQAKTYSLTAYAYPGSGTPPVSAAKVYQFQTVSGGVDLYSVTTQFVTGFQNSSSYTVALQFRWNTSSSYSSTIYIQPGGTYYFWNTPPSSTSPQVYFDQSVLAGWQGKTYSLSSNLYTGSGTPPFSAAKLYTFKNVNGGVDLYS